MGPITEESQPCFGRRNSGTHESASAVFGNLRLYPFRGLQVCDSVSARRLSHFGFLAVGFFSKQLGDDAQGIDFFLHAHQFLLFTAENFKRILHTFPTYA